MIYIIWGIATAERLYPEIDTTGELNTSENLLQGNPKWMQRF